ncbi:hypothetical protein POX_b02597 [Penicillium oxalicum]|uniref:hypothetical protein n=1 Tax=Penicillium oxalicum TaxID=69781 RepID=UPI0020B6B52C|nr:hypothetical protein POX_b02597 [Penicillium oxalicum]KAI2792559.1 hypothetical protein POX_b02597 [Penicillium oxalicum]
MIPSAKHLSQLALVVRQILIKPTYTSWEVFGQTFYGPTHNSTRLRLAYLMR